jgi:serine/threonine-protein kinase
VPEVLEGDQIAGCRIEAVAGRGGMGIVYRATQLSLGRPVAVKLISPDHAADPGFRERFERESRLAAAIDHPNVIPVHEAGEDHGRLYLVMRWVSGADLHGLIARSGRLEPRRAAAITAQVAGALDAAHRAGLVHRDVKPANVLLSGEHAYLADFGLTRPVASDTRLTTTGHWLGTADYMAPEQFGAEPVDARADVYALGCVLYAMLAGEPPFRRDTVPATMLAHLSDPPPRPSLAAAVPRELDAVIARALAKAPDDRYPSAGDLGRAAVAAAEGRAPSTEERSVARGAAAPRPTTNGTARLWASGTGATRRPRAGDPADAATRRPRAGDPADAATGRPPVDDPADAATRRLSPDPPHTDATRRLGPEPTDREPDVTLPLGDRPRRRRRRRRPLLRVAAAAAGGGLAAAAAIVLAPGGNGAVDPPGTPVSAGQVRTAAQAFATAYAHEDTAALNRLLTSDAQRVTPGSRQSGRKAVVAAYRRQFAANATRGFTLSDLHASGGAAGRATADYRADYAGGADARGRIVLRVVDDRGHPRVALIAATPSR